MSQTAEAPPTNPDYSDRFVIPDPKRISREQADQLQAQFDLGSQAAEMQKPAIELPESFGLLAVEGKFRDAKMRASTKSEKAAATMGLYEHGVYKRANAKGAASRAKSAEKGRGRFGTETRAIAREALSRSGLYTAIGATAFVGTFLTGGAGVIVPAALAARTAARTSRFNFRGQRNLYEDKNFAEKIKVADDGHKVTKNLARVSNVLSAPERAVAALTIRNEKNPSARRKLLTAALGAVAGSFFLRKIAEGARNIAEGTASYAITADNETSNSAFDLDKDNNGKFDMFENKTETASGDVEKPGGVDPSRYNRFERNEGFRMASIDNKFDWKNASQKDIDAYLRDTISNRPSLLASAAETRADGNVNFSEVDVNKRIEDYTVAGKNGEYSAEGTEANKNFIRAWDNGKTAREMTDGEIKDLRSNFILENHQTNEGQFENARDDKVSIAKSLNYHPELGDRLIIKEFEHGRTGIMKINPKDSTRHCTNWTTLRERPPEVTTPPTETPPPEKPPTETPPPEKPPTETPPPENGKDPTLRPPGHDNPTLAPAPPMDTPDPGPGSPGTPERPTPPPVERPSPPPAPAPEVPNTPSIPAPGPTPGGSGRI